VAWNGLSVVIADMCGTSHICIQRPQTSEPTKLSQTPHALREGLPPRGKRATEATKLVKVTSDSSDSYGKPVTRNSPLFEP
jgi:hypothetical protein